MESEDIAKLRKALRSLGRPDLAVLLDNAKSDLRISDTYGSRLFSRLSEFNIYCSPENYSKLSKLPPTDEEAIQNAVYLIYPTQDHEPEIYKINYLMDFEGVDRSYIVVTGRLGEISFDYVHQQIAKCHQKIGNADFDGAVTNARTLIESVCLFIYENLSGKSYKYDGNLGKLHKSVADLLQMNPEKYESQNLKRILTGISSIIHGVSEIRNAQSDSHGKAPSSQTYRVDDRHAIFVVNLSKSVSEYLFLSYIKAKQST
ncbi:MAG: abortive infection family protein [Acidobacteria bacterium]|nr:abortive infection family protein [Acidobacteriota bacterium]